MRSALAAALEDLTQGLGNWRLWSLLAWQDIKQRYRRSTLGPFWLTLSMGVTMVVMGVIMSILLNAGFGGMLPYVCTGLIAWGLVTQVINEGTTTFTDSMQLMMQVRQPLTLHLMRMVWRSLIALAHNMVIFVIVAVIYRITPTWHMILFVPALLLITLNLAWIALLLGVAAARFRDLPMIVQNLLTMLFWFTPIIYSPENLGDKAFVVNFNPFTALLQLFRAPLLGEAPSLDAWLTVGGAAVLGWALTTLVFARLRPRVAYWL